MRILLAKKIGLSLGLLLLLQLVLILPVYADDDDDLYNAPYYNAQTIPLSMMGTQSYLVGASETYLAWYVDSGSNRAVFGYDRVKNKLLNAGNGSTTIKPILTGSVVYYTNGNGILSYDLATEKPTTVVAAKAPITQLAADGDVLAYQSGSVVARLVSSGQEFPIDLKTSSADYLTVSGKNVFWTGQVSESTTKAEYSFMQFNTDRKATEELLRTDVKFQNLIVSGNRVVYLNPSPDNNSILVITSYDFASKNFLEFGSGGGASISGALVVYLSDVTQGKLRGYDITAKRPFLVVAAANEAFIFGKKVIWRKDFSNSQGKGRAYYESNMVNSLPTDQLPSRRINEAIPNTLFFYETGHSLRGQFQTYWEKNGGLDQFGFPTTEEFDEVNPSDGKVYKTQYFERARFEYHPENKAPYDVLLGLLAKQVTVGRENEEPFLEISREKAADKYFFQETGHSISGPIRTYWEKTGGLPVYGFPITEPFDEVNPADGKTYLVQYFERNRLEYHPENARTKYEVQLGLLGNQVLSSRGWLG